VAVAVLPVELKIETQQPIYLADDHSSKIKSKHAIFSNYCSKGTKMKQVL